MILQFRSLDAEVRELLDRARQHRFVPSHHYGSLYEFRIFSHDAN